MQRQRYDDVGWGDRYIFFFLVLRVSPAQHFNVTEYYMHTVGNLFNLNGKNQPRFMCLRTKENLFHCFRVQTQNAIRFVRESGEHEESVHLFFGRYLVFFFLYRYRTSKIENERF